MVVTLATLWVVVVSRARYLYVIVRILVVLVEISGSPDPLCGPAVVAGVGLLQNHCAA